MCTNYIMNIILYHKYVKNVYFGYVIIIKSQHNIKMFNWKLRNLFYISKIKLKL